MNHDPAMSAMLTSTWLLLAAPFLFVIIGVLWYRQSVNAQDRRFEEEAELHGRDEVEAR